MIDKVRELMKPAIHQINDRKKLDVIFSMELKYLMATSYIVLSNNAVSDRHIEANFGIPVHAWSSLFAIQTFPGIKAKEIRKLFPRPQNTISRAITLLEKRGFIQQQISDEDGREKQLFITTNGCRILKEIYNYSVARQADIFAPLTADELDVYFELTKKIVHGSALRNPPQNTS